MSEKVKKQASSVPFSLSRWFQRISTMKPSTMLVTIVIMGVGFFLFAGGVYDIIKQPLPAVYYNQKFYFLYPALSEQFLFDTVISGILYIVGFAGLLTIYQSARHAYSPRQAYMSMVIGVAFLFIAYLFLEYFVRIKMSG
jgi:hypothetical protein